MPVLRASDAQLNQLMTQSLQKNNLDINFVFEQMSTGKRIQSLSDDPIDSINLLNLERQLTAIEQYKTNVDNVKTNLSIQEGALQGIVDGFKRVRDLLLWAKNDTLTDADRLGILAEIEALNEGATSLLNTQDENGIYLFSGTLSDQASIVGDNNIGFTLQGNTDLRLVNVAKGISVQSNYTAQQMFDLGAGQTVFESIRLLNQGGIINTAGIDGAIGDLDVTLGNILENITRMGGQQNALDLIQSNHIDNETLTTKVSSEIEQLDYAEASVQLTNLQNALQATQASFVTITGMSLFDRL